MSEHLRVSFLGDGFVKTQEVTIPAIDAAFTIEIPRHTTAVHIVRAGTSPVVPPLALELERAAQRWNAIREAMRSDRGPLLGAGAIEFIQAHRGLWEAIRAAGKPEGTEG